MLHRFMIESIHNPGVNSELLKYKHLYSNSWINIRVPEVELWSKKG
jgi:hypothetical protein